jgi:hypothetical protein
MHRTRLVLKKRTSNSNLPLPARKNLAAGQIERRAFDITLEAGLAEGENHAPNARPVNGPRAHGARFGACVESARGEFGVRKQPARSRTGKQLGVLGRISARPHGIVARLNHDRSSGIDNERAERVTTVGAGLAGQFNGAAEKSFVNRGKGLRWHEVSKPDPASGCQAPKPQNNLQAKENKTDTEAAICRFISRKLLF